MAKQRKKAAAKARPAKDQTKATAKDVRPTISKKKLLELMSTARSTQNDINEIAGGFGSAVKIAVDKHHLHRKAFNVIKQADRMEPEKLADFLDNLEDYLEISGLNARAAQVQRMEFGPGNDAAVEEDEDGAEETTDEEDTSNVKPFPKPNSVAAE